MFKGDYPPMQQPDISDVTSVISNNWRLPILIMIDTSHYKRINYPNRKYPRQSTGDKAPLLKSQLDFSFCLKNEESEYKR